MHVRSVRLFGCLLWLWQRLQAATPGRSPSRSRRSDLGALSPTDFDGMPGFYFASDIIGPSGNTGNVAAVGGVTRVPSPRLAVAGIGDAGAWRLGTQRRSARALAPSQHGVMSSTLPTLQGRGHHPGVTAARWTCERPAAHRRRHPVGRDVRFAWPLPDRYRLNRPDQRARRRHDGAAASRSAPVALTYLFRLRRLYRFLGIGALPRWSYAGGYGLC